MAANRDFSQESWDLLSVLQGVDVMTRCKIEEVEAISGHDYSKARSLVKEHPEVKELYKMMRAEQAFEVKQQRKLYENTLRRLNMLAQKYNNLCDEHGVDDFIEPYYA